MIKNNIQEKKKYGNEDSQDSDDSNDEDYEYSNSNIDDDDLRINAKKLAIKTRKQIKYK